MPLFLTQVSYTDQAWQSLVANPQNRVEALRPVFENLGGRVVNAWFAFGDYDIVLVSELPDNVSAAALAIAASAGGACKTVKTTPLMDTRKASKPSGRRQRPAITLRQEREARTLRHGATQIACIFNSEKGIPAPPGCPFSLWGNSSVLPPSWARPSLPRDTRFGIVTEAIQI